MVPPRVCAAVTAIALAAAAPGSALAAPLSEDFDSGASGWQTSGLWRIQDHPEALTVSPAIGGVLTSVPAGAPLPPAWSGTGVAWFGDPATGTYCAGFAAIAQHPSDGCRSDAPVSGALTSPPFALPGPSATLRFRAWWEIAAAGFEQSDQMTVEYSTDGGTTWTVASRINPSGPPLGSLHQPYTSGGLRAPGVWQDYAVDLTPALGSADVRVRFRFDSVDTLGQGFRGWLVDAVTVDGSEIFVNSAPGAGEPPGAGAPGESGQPGGLANGPVPGRTFLAERVSGRLTYAPPGASQPLLLVGPTLVPVGTIVDSRHGVVRITAVSADGHTQTGTFHDGLFQLREPAGEGVVELALVGGRFPPCDNGCTSVRRHRTLRNLWGSATGAFRIVGRYAAATVRGTNWLVDDRLGDTLVKVRIGSVLVRDFVKDVNVIVNAGQSYDARVIYTNRQRSNPRFGSQYTLAVRGGRVVHVYLTHSVVI